MWELEVVESWRFVTATELASEPKPAGESSAVAHSHCEPRPFLEAAECFGYLGRFVEAERVEELTPVEQ